jgi:Flp pilus assembly protein TadG
MRKDERGQALVEMALVMPILLLLLAGIADIGRLIFSYEQMQMAAQESVRLGGLHKNDTTITNFAVNYVTMGDPSKMKVVITPQDTNRKSGDYVTVKLSYPFSFYTPFVSQLFPSPFYIETQSTMRVE